VAVLTSNSSARARAAAAIPNLDRGSPNPDPGAPIRIGEPQSDTRGNILAGATF
jgi:hypothetical protein